MHLPVVQWKQWHWILFNKDWKYTWNEDDFFWIFGFLSLSIVAVNAIVYVRDLKNKIKTLMRQNGKEILVKSKVDAKRISKPKKGNSESEKNTTKPKTWQSQKHNS